MKANNILSLFEYVSDNEYDPNLLRDLYNKNYIITKSNLDVLIDPIISWFKNPKPKNYRFSPAITFSNGSVDKQLIYNASLKRFLLYKLERTKDKYDPIQGLKGVDSDNKVIDQIIKYLKGLKVDLDPFMTLEFSVVRSRDGKTFTITYETYKIDGINSKRDEKEEIEGKSEDFEEIIKDFFGTKLVGFSLYSSLYNVF